MSGELVSWVGILQIVLEELNHRTLPVRHECIQGGLREKERQKVLVVIEKGRRVVITCMLVDSNCFDLCHAPKGSCAHMT